MLTYFICDFMINCGVLPQYMLIISMVCDFMIIVGFMFLVVCLVHGWPDDYLYKRDDLVSGYKGYKAWCGKSHIDKTWP